MVDFCVVCGRKRIGKEKAKYLSFPFCLFDKSKWYGYIMVLIKYYWKQNKLL